MFGLPECSTYRMPLVTFPQQPNPQNPKNSKCLELFKEFCHYAKKYHHCVASAKDVDYSDTQMGKDNAKYLDEYYLHLTTLFKKMIQNGCNIEKMKKEETSVFSKQNHSYLSTIEGFKEFEERYKNPK